MTLNQEVVLLKQKIERLITQIAQMSKDMEEGKVNKPYSKVGFDRYMANQDKEFDGNEGIWKSYAIYKDDEE